MIPTNFEYFAPTTIADAVQLLAQHGDDCKVLAGGHSLLPAMKLRLTQIPVIIDIGKITDLSYITIDGGTIRIGAMTTHGAVAASADIQQHCPLLAECGAQVGDQQVRNRGTIGGSLVHADPAADWPAAILALNAELVLQGAAGSPGANGWGWGCASTPTWSRRRPGCGRWAWRCARPWSGPAIEPHFSHLPARPPARILAR